MWTRREVPKTLAGGGGMGGMMGSMMGGGMMRNVLFDAAAPRCSAGAESAVSVSHQA